MRAYQNFTDYMAGVNDILNTMNILNWDARTQMPLGGNVSRGFQLATLSGLAQEKLVANQLQHLLADAERETSSLRDDAIERRSLQAVREASELFRRTPERLTRDLAQLRAEAQQCWGEARAKNDFGKFAPLLERMVGLQRELAQVIGYTEHPYDALVGLYEPDMTHAKLQDLFTRLKAGISGGSSLAHELELETWDRVMAVNLRGPFLCAKYAIPHLMAGGAILNVASTYGLIGAPLAAAYCASRSHQASVSSTPCPSSPATPHNRQLFWTEDDSSLIYAPPLF